MTLCACWEQYVEDVIIEGAELIAKQSKSPSDLPLPVRKVVSKKVKTAKDELKPLELAGRGWKDIYLAYAKNDVGNLHSPKTENIERLLLDYLGLDDLIREVWSHGKDGVDAFVGLRNSIAHNGKASGRYIKYYEVGSSIDLVTTTIAQTDNRLSEYLADILPEGRPWNRTNN